MEDREYEERLLTCSKALEEHVMNLLRADRFANLPPDRIESWVLNLAAYYRMVYGVSSPQA